MQVDSVLALVNGELDELESAQAMQGMINSGDAWRMEGSFGRSAMSAIEAGHCMLGPRMVRDFWGTPVPGRDDVKPGTEGSRDYVVDRMGEDHAAALEQVS